MAKLSGEGVLNISETINEKKKPGSQIKIRRYQWPILFSSLILTDLLMVGLGFWAAFLVRFDLSLPLFEENALRSNIYYFRLILVMVPTWLIIFAAMGLYQRQNLMGGVREYMLLFRAVTVGVMAVIIIGFFGEEFIIARGWLLLSWVLAFVFAAIGRFVIRRIVYFLRKYGWYVSSAILVGSNDEARALAEQLHHWPSSGINLVGYVDDYSPADFKLYGELSLLGQMEDLDAIVEQHHIDEVIVASSAIPREKILGVFKRHGLSDRVNVRLSTGLFEMITTGIQVSEFASVPLLRVNKVRLTGFDNIVKIVLDYGLTIPGLILISPVMAVIALMVKLDSPGPVIHRRRVMGVNGKQFDAFKFRTMAVNGDEILDKYPELQKELIENHKLKTDPRITRIGRFLRKLSLDELPQLLNVLRNEMSLVGPRMISPEEMSKYNQWGINLLTVKPGITGLWQVSGRSDIGYDDRIRLDMYYIRNWTVWMDIGLLIKTIPAALSSRGAY